MIKFKNISVSVDKKSILKDITFELKPGKITALMGPNGSGKSTIALTLAGHPNYQVTSGKIILDKKDISKLSPDKRANLGIFLSNQSPVAIPGLNVKTFLWQIFKKFHSDQKMSLSEFRDWLAFESDTLGIKNELLDRSLNDGFSGGERKKMEVLQMLVANPKYLILDEIDSGLDVDALKTISLRIQKLAQDLNSAILIITHAPKILEYLNPNQVLVLDKGQIKTSGDASLAQKIISSGFQS
jgi:Fe-S cluster assembly ATP-binding protein